MEVRFRSDCEDYVYDNDDDDGDDDDGDIDEYGDADGVVDIDHPCEALIVRFGSVTRITRDWR